MNGSESNEKKVEVLVQREQTIAEVSHGVFPHLEQLVQCCRLISLVLNVLWYIDNLFKQF